MKIWIRIAVFVAACCFPSPARGQEPEGEDASTLREELAAERRAREALEARFVRKEAEERARAEREKIAVLPLTLSGFVHVDWIVLRQSSQNELTRDRQPLNDQRFLLRRARLRGERDFGLFHGLVELDANTVAGPQVRPFYAEASFKWPATQPYARAPWALDRSVLPSGNGRLIDPKPVADGP